MLCCNLAEVEMELFVVSFLRSRMTEFDPEVTPPSPIEGFRCRSCTRRDGERGLSKGRRGTNFGHAV